MSVHDLLAHPAEARIICWVVFVARRAIEHTPRAEPLDKFRILWIVVILKFFLGIQMIEVAKELVETMNSRQKLVAITKVVLADLRGGIAMWLKQLLQWLGLPSEEALSWRREGQP